MNVKLDQFMFSGSLYDLQQTGLHFLNERDRYAERGDMESVKDLNDNLAIIRQLTQNRYLPERPIDLTTQRSVASLLLNGWSAEYALRVHRIDSREDIAGVFEWCIPHAFYSTLFSIRAALAIHHVRMATPDEINAMLHRLILSGNYPKAALTDEGETCFDLFGVLKDRHKPSDLSQLAVSTVVQAHRWTIKQVERINLVHESLIVASIGMETYRTIVVNAPEYLQKSFLANRLSILATA